jgi:hypothetical protein
VCGKCRNSRNESARADSQTYVVVVLKYVVLFLSDVAVVVPKYYSSSLQFIVKVPSKRFQVKDGHNDNDNKENNNNQRKLLCT